MKRTNWYWDLGLPFSKIKEILADEHHPEFARIAGYLFARNDNPSEVFSLMTPLTFCRRFQAIRRQIRRDEWTKEREALWRATYERHVRQFRRDRVRIRQRETPEVDLFTRELVTKLRTCREGAHLSQAELAKKIGCSQQFVSSVERGRENLTVDYLQRFAQAAGCAFDITLRPLRELHVEEEKVAEDYTDLNTWIEGERREALALAKARQKDKGLMELVAYRPNAVLNARQDAWRFARGITLEARQNELGEALKEVQFQTQNELKAAMEATAIHTFGWPIGAVLDRTGFAPQPYRDGIRAKIVTPDTFDYWALRTDLVFYLLMNLFEDQRSEGKIFLDTRVIRTTEAIVRISRLYEKLGVRAKEEVVIKIRYTGLRGRILSVADPSKWMFDREAQPCVEDTVETSLRERLGNISHQLVDLVHAAICELGMLFNYYQPSKDRFIKPLVERFMRGPL